jgi:hypothetical protein
LCHSKPERQFTGFPAKPERQNKIGFPSLSFNPAFGSKAESIRGKNNIIIINVKSFQMPGFAGFNLYPVLIFFQSGYINTFHCFNIMFKKNSKAFSLCP